MIGIIAAMDIEVDAIKAVSTITATKTVAGCQMYLGTLGDKEIVIGKSGVGKSYAAMATTILCMSYPIDKIINVGTAGGLKEDENVLDIVISDQVVQADYDTSPIDGPEGIGLVYPVDPEMVKASIQASQENHIPYHVGTIASQDLFMSREEDYQKLLKHFPASICSEMEAGAVAQVCTKFEIPFVILRGLSDVVHHSGNEMEFSEYASKASQQSAKMIQALLTLF